MLVLVQYRPVVEELDQMKVDLMFTNDWEIFGEGSGNFTDLQERPLREFFEVFDRHAARFTLFAEIGQQWAHRSLGQAWSEKIAESWEALVAETIGKGHDVQLHLHPTWLNAKFEHGAWHLDFSQWQLKTLSQEKIEEVLRRGRNTLENLGHKVNPKYRCLAFRAGAFCIQPENETMPGVLKAGLMCDSSVVPGMTDHLFFDFRSARSKPGSYLACVENLGREAIPGEKSILEFPIHTARVWDMPLVRRLLPGAFFERFQFGTSPDAVFEKWAKARDARQRTIYPSSRQPLQEKRKRALRGPRRWPGFFLRKSLITLDYDYLAPQVFVSLVERAVARAQREGKQRLRLVAIGHAKNIHSAENVDRILAALKNKLGPQLRCPTIQQAVEEQLAGEIK